MRKLRIALYLKIFVKGKENRTLQLDNKLVDIKTSVYQRIIWRFFKMQVKMNLMHSELVLIKINTDKQPVFTEWLLRPKALC